MTNPEWLKAATQRSGQERWTLGYVFEQYLKLERKSAEQLAQELGCLPEALNWLALCRRPDDERFTEHLRRIEERFAVKPQRLALVLRHVEGVDSPLINKVGKSLVARTGIKESGVRLAPLLPGEEEPKGYPSATRSLLDREGGSTRAEDDRVGFEEELKSTLDLDTWMSSYDLELLIADICENVVSYSEGDGAVQSTIRSKLFEELRSWTRLDEAGVYEAHSDRLRLVFEGLLFPGRVEATSSIVFSPDNPPLGITQIGVSMVGYGGSSGTFSQRLFRKATSVVDDDATKQNLDQLVRHHARSRVGRRGGLSVLARKFIRDYAERTILLHKSTAEWRLGCGNPCSRELLSGNGSTNLLKKSLELLRELVGHKKFVYVPPSLNKGAYLTLGQALKVGEYAIIQTLEPDSTQFVEKWDYSSESERGSALSFVKDCCPDVLIGLFRASELASPRMFFAHRENVHMAAHIAMADSRIHSRRNFPMLLDIADASCRGVFGSDPSEELVHDISYPRVRRVSQFQRAPRALTGALKNVG